MPAPRAKNTSDALIAEIGQLSNDAARRKFLAKHAKLVRQSTIEQLAQLVVQRVRVSTKEALHLAEAAILIAKRLRRKAAQALALRAMANALIPPAIIAPQSNITSALSKFTSPCAIGRKWHGP